MSKRKRNNLYDETLSVANNSVINTISPTSCPRISYDELIPIAKRLKLNAKHISYKVKKQKIIVTDAEIKDNIKCNTNNTPHPSSNTNTSNENMETDDQSKERLYTQKEVELLLKKCKDQVSKQYEKIIMDHANMINDLASNKVKRSEHHYFV